MQTTVADTEEAARAKREAARARALANLKPFQKGCPSGNPRGRPKKDYVLADLAQKHAEKAIATLVKVMSDDEATASARVAAASELLDRGFGRAPQSLDVKTTVSLSDEFEALIRRLGGGEQAKVIEHSVD